MNSGCFLLLLLATSVQATSYLIVNVPSLIILDGSDFRSEVLFLRVCVSTDSRNQSCNIGNGWGTGYHYIFPELFVELKGLPEGHIWFNITIQTDEDLIAIDSFKTTVASLTNLTRNRIDSHTAVEFMLKYTTSVQCVKNQKINFDSQFPVYDMYDKHCDNYCRASIRIFILLMVLMIANVVLLCCNFCKKDCRKKAHGSHDTTASAAWLFGDNHGFSHKRTPPPTPNDDPETAEVSEVAEVPEDAMTSSRTETIV